jgi:hypothetical protein
MDKEEKGKIVLSGTYEGSYTKFAHIRANRCNNKKINFNVIKALFKRRKKNKK